jgi:formate C-acetyltransferase
MTSTFEWAPVSERIRRIRDRKDGFFRGERISVNTERTRIYTDYCRTNDAQHPLLKRAGALYAWASQKQCTVFDDDVIVGTLGPDEQSLSFYVDWGCRWIPGVTDEATFKEAWQSPGSVYMSDEQREVLVNAYDYWKTRSLSELLEGAMTDDMWEGFGNGSALGTLTKYDAGYTWLGGVAQGHYIGNFNKAVNIGFAAVRAEALAILDAYKGKIFGDFAKKHLFYHAVVTVCDAAILLSKRYAESCRAKAAETRDEARKAELLQMADSLEWIMEKPARTYWEGLQAIILYQMLLSTDAQQHGQSMGRIDKYVGHLLDKDFAEGLITREQAQEYSDAFILRITDFIMIHGFSMSNTGIINLRKSGMNAYSSMYIGVNPTAGIALTLGGTKVNGEDDSNKATLLLLQTYGRMKLTDPTVALRVGKNTPETVWQAGIEASKIAGGMPQFQNDEILIQSLLKVGLSVEDAYNYSIVGCVEPSGTGNEWSASGNTGSDSIWNMMEALQITINGGVHPRTGKQALPCKKLYEYDSFEEFQTALAAQMQYALDWTVSYTNLFEQVYSTFYPCVSASTLLDGCLESGKDATEGGAKYNRTGLTACGTANFGDSLVTIKKLCFDDKSVSLRELYAALEADWVGYEPLRQKIINEVPHYGNNIDEADELAAWGLGKFSDIMAAEVGPRGNFCGGTFTMTANVYFGQATGATPDGRKAGEPIADAISPRQGYDTNGPTAYLLSASKLPHLTLSNGDQLNIRFTPNSVEGSEGASKLKSLMQTYFSLGGHQVQFNVVSTEKLRAAQANPEAYKDLVVRIAGFSTYFVALSRDVQEDFIARTELAV